MTTSLPPLSASLQPDLEKAERFLAAYPPPGRLIQCGVTGAHFYGFPSPDSDLDLKGVHLAPTRTLLGLDRPQETHDVLTDFEGLEHDLTTHEAAKALTLLLQGNGNVLERLLSPFQLVESEEAEALAELARGAVSQAFYRHYRGFFGGMQREHGVKGRAKTMLYAYRVALTGVPLLETGEVVGDVRVLGPAYGFDEVSELVELKAAAAEKAPLGEAEDARFRARWPALEARLEEARARSTLPEAPTNRGAMNEWLVRLRGG